jgi:quercetin dioxygenase-like cupin family protein
VDPGTNIERFGPQALSVLLVDDHAVSRAACRALLCTEGADVAGDVAVGEDVIALAARIRPDIAIVDVGLIDQVGLDLARRIREVGLAVSVVLTSSAERSALGAALDAFPFVAKTNLCLPEVLGSIRTHAKPRKGETMQPPSTNVIQASQPLWFLHNLAIIHARRALTTGSYGVVELTGAPGDVPPLHVHHHDDEGFYVLEGAIRLHIAGEDPIHLRPGQFQLAPRGVPHVYVVESDEPARWLTISNGGFDRFVEEVGVPASEPVLPSDPSMPPPDELTAIAARHGIELLGPPGAMPLQGRNRLRSRQ